MERRTPPAVSPAAPSAHMGAIVRVTALTTAKHITAWKINSHTVNNHRKEICFATRLFSSCFNADNFFLNHKLEKKKKGRRERKKEKDSENLHNFKVLNVN